MGQGVNVAALPVSCRPPKERLDRTTTSGSKERGFLSDDRRGLGGVEGARADAEKLGKTAEDRRSRTGAEGKK